MQVSLEVASLLSVTVRRKVRDAPSGPTSGAVKPGCSAVGSVRVTGLAVPTCSHKKDLMPLSLSSELEPFKVTVTPSSTV